MGKKRGDKTLTAKGDGPEVPPQKFDNQRQLNMELRIEVRNVQRRDISNRK
jgi:hypothetical protein